MTFKQLFDDDAVANSLESLAGTLKAAKKKKFVDYGPELLLQVSQLEWAVGEVIMKGNAVKIHTYYARIRVSGCQ